MPDVPLRELDTFVADSLALIGDLASLEVARDAEAPLIGKRSPLALWQRSLGDLEPEARRDAGARLQEARRILEAALAARVATLRREERDARLERDALDLGDVVTEGMLWPLSEGRAGLVARTQRELEDVFIAMGFQVADGPEVESDWYNFEALNMPPAHPARGMWDTFYVELGEPETVVLRTHTSPTQIHLMEAAVRDATLPIHSVMPGRCYRRDT
ncbi:MAG: hypothetical protein B7X07_06485, partial [Actinobacteria bacterium 21-64-8]